MKVQILRNWSRIFLMLLVAIHMVTWFALGIHVVGFIGFEGLLSGLSRGVLNAAFVFWMLVLISVLLFGRAFCGWFCWFGGYLDLIEWGISDKLKVKLPRTMPLYLAVIPFGILFAKVYGSPIVNWLNGFPATFIFNLADIAPWGGQQATTSSSILIIFVLYGPVLFYFFGQKAWCRYLCPFGALLKIFARIGIGKVRLVSEECNGCGKCNRVCEMQVDVLGNLKDHGQIVSSDCTRCLKCSDECPMGAIAFRMRQKSNVRLSADAASKAEKASLKRRQLSAFDITITVLWFGVTLSLLFNADPHAPQAMRITMAAVPLLVIYGMVWLGQNAWHRFKRKGEDTS